MKKKRFTGLVVLMGFSLIGIILVQFLWVNNAVQVQKERFNVTIYDALNATVQRAQKEQAADSFLQQFMSFASSNNDTSSFNDNQNSTPYFPQPGEKEKKDVKELIKGKNKIEQPFTNGSFQAHIEIESSGKPKQVITRSGNFDINSNKDIKHVEKAISLMEDSIKKVMEINSNINPLKILNQFSYEIKMRSADVSNRINTDNLTQILEYELNARGIDLNYEYGILNRNDGSLTKHYSKNYYKDKSEFKFVANLFPNDYFRSLSPLVLDIYFPLQQQFIYKSLGLLLGSSILFTFLILLSFYFTLRTILNQKKLSEIKSDFINNMTHEFKTPIATINLATDNIANPKIIDKPDYISPFLKIIKEENKRMNNQVERVLQMSLIEKSDFQLMPANTDLHQLINDAIAKMQLLANQKSAIITSDLKADLTVFNVDEIHFTNVVVNLLENALKYSKQDPHINITTLNNKNGIEIMIKDNGIGMSKEQQAKVFEKFFRATKGNIHNVKGFGLGLSYVKAIMVEHGGNVFVKSKLGEGSEFKLFLPFKS
jgi:two-component system phosphate regulon sensor histidine kinase PhoR